MKIKYLLFLILPAFVFASSGGAEVEKDFLVRTINFLIFFGILYYLVAEHIRNFFSGRINGIANSLDEIQVKLAQSRSQKSDAIKEVEDAKKLAVEIIATAKDEAKLLSQKIADDSRIEIENIEKAHKDRIEIEERKMVRDVIGEIIDDIFNDKSVSLNKDDFINLVLKKAA